MYPPRFCRSVAKVISEIDITSATLVFAWRSLISRWNRLPACNRRKVALILGNAFMKSFITSVVACGGSVV